MEYEVNCQISNNTRESDEDSVNKGTWTFYQNLESQQNVSKYHFTFFFGELAYFHDMWINLIQIFGLHKIISLHLLT